jgi:D-xylose transport system permease protein
MAYQGAMLAIGRGISISPMNPDFRLIADSYVPPVVGYALAAVAILAVAMMVIRGNNSKKKYGLQTEAKALLIGKIVFFSAIILLFIFVMNNYKGIPMPVMIMFVLVLIFSFVSTKTRFGRNIYSIGGNPSAAKFAGINVKSNLLLIYTLNGFMAATAGIVLGARLNAGMPNAGQNYELDAIAAAVIGGASMSGGVGHVAGAILGAVFMTTIDNGMSMMNIDQSWQYMLKGAILLVAVWFDMRTQKKQG